MSENLDESVQDGANRDKTLHERDVAEQAAQERTVPTELAGQRVDQVLAKLFDGLSRREAQRLLRRGAVVAGSKRLRAHDRVTVGSRLCIELAKLEARNEETLAGLRQKQADAYVLYRGKHWAAVRKPSGLPSLPLFYSDRLHFAARAQSLVQGDPSLPEHGLVHRLDNDTSGVCAVGITNLGFEALLMQRRSGELFRVYWAVVSGLVEGPLHVAEPISHDPRDPSRMRIASAGLAAETRARVLSTTGAGSSARSLLEVRIKGGRRHQIRVHLAHLGLPIVGDSLYGRKIYGPEIHGPKIHGPKIHGPKIHEPEIHEPKIHEPKIHEPNDESSHAFGDTESALRLGLHARRLELVDPDTNERRSVTAKAGEHFWQLCPPLRLADD